MSKKGVFDSLTKAQLLTVCESRNLESSKKASVEELRSTIKKGAEEFQSPVEEYIKGEY